MFKPGFEVLESNQVYHEREDEFDKNYVDEEDRKKREAKQQMVCEAFVEIIAS